MRKYPDGQRPSQDVIEQDIAAINIAIDKFAAGMKKAMAEKAREGRYGWNDPALRNEIYGDMLAHAVVAEKTPRKEVHIANYAMMLHFLDNGSSR